jgi:hypothetical protein
MTRFDRALEAMAGARRAQEEARPGNVARMLSSEAQAGTRYRPGDRVRDRVTGQEGTVERSVYRHETVAAPGGSGGGVRDRPLG